VRLLIVRLLIVRPLLHLALAACASAPAPIPTTPAPVAATPAPAGPRAPDPDLHHPPPRRVLDIDWAQVHIAGDADALALWQRIAPTGADWQDRLSEIPPALTRPLAIALLHGGNFTCAKPPTGDCAKPLYDEPEPTQTAGFDDPCLRRDLALWSLSQLDDADVPAVHDALRAIAALPPPESQLVDAAVHAIPSDAQDDRLDIIAIAWRAGQREIVEAAAGKLDDAHLVDAIRRHHIASALELVAAADHRDLYLAAVSDESLPTRARTAAINELTSDTLPADLTKALVTATRAKDCAVAALAARTLDQHGDHRFVPRRRATDPAGLMRSLCVVTSYQALQAADEPSLLASYLPARGLERMTITYDPLSETDPDGDGDPHTTHSAEIVPRAEAVMPEAEDLARAFQHCTGTICVSDEHEFRFVFAAGSLIRLEVADRPPCS
jgi:hypothetical protein